jgi:hypothetical protein
MVHRRQHPEGDADVREPDARPDQQVPAGHALRRVNRVRREQLGAAATLLSGEAGDLVGVVLVLLEPDEPEHD